MKPIGECHLVSFLLKYILQRTFSSSEFVVRKRKEQSDINGVRKRLKARWKYVFPVNSFIRVECSIFQTAWATLLASTVQQVREEA